MLVLNTMRQRITAIAQTLILHKTARYFVENRNENINKQALLQRSRAAYAWDIAWAMKFNRKHRSLPDRSGEVCVLVLWGDRRPCSVSVVVGRRTRDREVASSVPGRCIAG